MQLFSADAIVFSKKKYNSEPQNMKNCPLKLLIIGPQLFFMYWPVCANCAETEILYHKKPINAGLGI